MRSFAIATVLALTGTAAAEKPKVLVLPLAPTTAVDAGAARTFDARLLVALDDSRRVQTVTYDEEPECTTLKCLADLGTETGSHYVLSMSVVKEDGGLTLFGTLVDVKSGTAWRRIELPRIDATTLARNAPKEIVPQILGTTPSGAPVLAFAKPANDAGIEAARVIQDRVAATRAIEVAPFDGAANRATPTHRAEIVVSEFSIAETRPRICTWLEGRLVATFSVTELTTGRVVFTKAVDIQEARRKTFSSRVEVRDVLVARAVEDWLAAFRPQTLVAKRK
jgi:hypothetical protein